ncbi:MAG: sigma-70 family RNA polymerase sigma factor, partial [Thermoleophilia bacterium]|nr:sigma-70 family RNA polymerase sigma factor [Thermoleophilia bacterium]
MTTAELEQLYRDRYRSFLRVAIALLHDTDRAHDAVQEAFARSLSSQRSYRGEGGLEAWVYSTLLNVCRDTLRRGEPPSEQLCANGRADPHPELRAAIAGLPKRQRLAIFLRYYADLDYDAIAVALSVERGTVAASLHAAHARLRST